MVTNFVAPCKDNDFLSYLFHRHFEQICDEKFDFCKPKLKQILAFEKGVYLEKFDSVFNVDASIKSDTAYYYEKQKLWKLMSNVHIQNLKGVKFDTDLLYWDQNKHTIYSDRFIRIEQPDRIITGRGFDSNEQMTVYTIRKPEGIFYVDDDATAPADSVQTDSMPKDSIKP